MAKANPLHVILAALTVGGGLLAGSQPAAAGPAITAEVEIRTARVVGDEAGSKAVSQAIKGAQPRLLACYEAHRKQAPGEVGVLSLSVRIEPGGSAGQSTVVSSAVPAALKDCATGVIKGLSVTPWTATSRRYATVEVAFQLRSSAPRKARIYGGVPKAIVAGVVEARLPALRRLCLAGAPRMRKVWLRLHAEFDGQVKTASVQGRVGNLKARRCLEKQLRSWDFPAPSNGHRTWVQYPWPQDAGAPARQAAPARP